MINILYNIIVLYVLHNNVTVTCNVILNPNSSSKFPIKKIKRK